MTEKPSLEISRRHLLVAAASAAAAPMLASTPSVAHSATSGTTASSEAQPLFQSLGRRRLGLLEVSSVGLGVQNMSRTYQTTIPSRSEMLNIIHTAFDHGITFLTPLKPMARLKWRESLAKVSRLFETK